MLKVKAVWTVGYPSGPGRKIYSGGEVFECDESWGKKKAAQGRVEILEGIEEEKQPEIKADNETETLSLEEKLEKYNQGYGWYEIPGVEQNVRKDEAIEILKEKM